ncbi:hypothetical protein JAAARDRAFT_28852 [Jaapia argillacea MUCL 33604]|uniref:CAP-Gly domain-containing protein n=1 Tax=Jaapia argillacea MUCL 33604 TaxID=933084 RepID=A0A067Q7B8_9AGAM|nr:hypothetical protein JAAARDRAFT_28852 [Jaapia argillacea MUCL 33604]
MDPPLGALVEVPPGRGTVRFAGPTAFAPGKWIGIELHEANGKNDGSIKGVQYFTCKPGYGVFVRPSQVKVVEEQVVAPVPQNPVRASISNAVTSRPGLSHARTGSSSAPPSHRPTPPPLQPSPHPSSTRSSSPAKGRSQSPAKPSTQNLKSPIVGQAPRLPSPTKRTSNVGLPGPGGLQPRKSLGRPSLNFENLGHPPSPSLASPSPRVEHTFSPLGQSQGPGHGLGRTPPVLPIKRTSSPPPIPASLTRRTSSPPPMQPAHPPSAFSFPPQVNGGRAPSRPASSLSNNSQPPPPHPDTIALQTSLSKIHDLESSLHTSTTKIRVLEAKRTDDHRHILELEARLNEAESFVSLRPKLQAKVVEQAKELGELRRRLVEVEQVTNLSENRHQDAQEQLEMAMLDKEVAEERAEVAEMELEELREKLAVVEVELGVLKGGGESGVGEDDGLGESDGEEERADPAKSSLAYIQLEKQNERLKEALVRLRDLSSETEQEQRRRIQEMEKDVAMLDELQISYEDTLSKLANSDTQIEDLKLQLDDALGAEDLLVQLTERNLMLSEKIEEMRITIEDLEALKELNDELEENHMETEKAMQEDLDLKDTQIRDHQRRVEALEDACLDMEGTINQFRELVLQLQTELDGLRAQTHTAKEESASAASQTAAMMSLNLKLQSTASKHQAKHIEHEILRLEAREAKELLSIVQPYLPQLYVESDTDATNCYLFFRRLGYKADLINSVVAQAHGLPESLNGPIPDVLVGICEMRGRIASLSTLCKRFAAVLRHCDVESFLQIGRLYPELAPMEKRIDMHIDLLRRDEFREMECVSDVAKLQAQFDHLAETYFAGFDHDLGERELGYATSFELDLDMVSASMGLAKTSIAVATKDNDVVLDLAGYDMDIDFFEPLQKLLDQCKSAKVVSRKLTKRLEDLIRDSSALKAHLIPQLQALNNVSAELVNFGIQLAQQIMPHISDVRSSKSSFQLGTVLSFVRQIASSTVAKTRKEGLTTWELVSEYITNVIQEANALLPLSLETENAMKITGTAPWVIRVQEIKASTAINVEAERKLAQLNDEMQGLYRTLKSKDQHIQETTVKIELMDRRMEAVKKQADTITDLEGELSKARKQERAYEEAMEQLQADLDVLEQENAKLKVAAPGPQREASGAPAAEADSVPVEGSLETSYLLEQIEALRGTVRYLRTENSYLKGQDLLKEIEALPALPIPSSREPTPPLDPSGFSDSDDSDSEIPHTPPTLRSLSTETKLLYRDVIKFSSSPRVVDLSELNAKRAQGKGGKVWMPMKKTPAHQVIERRQEAERLSRRVKGLMERASNIGNSR